MSLETIEYKGLTITLHPDEDAEDPIEMYGGGIKLVSFHRRRGERHGFDSWEEVLAHARETGGYAAPVRAYEHGGIAFTVVNPDEPGELGYPFNDLFDSGWYGLLLLENEYVREWWPTAKRLSPQRKKKLYESAVSWVESYQRWANGEYVGYVVEDAEGSHIDSCFGFDDWDYAVSQAQEAADFHLATMKESA